MTDSSTGGPPAITPPKPTLPDPAAPFVAVASTWGLRPVIWLLAGLLSLVVLGTATVQPRGSLAMPASLLALQLAAVTMGVAALTNDQARRQFVTPAARLTPGYAGPHLTLLVLAALVYSLLALFIGARVGASPVGSIALGATMASLTVWASHRPELGWFLTLALLTTLASPVAAFWLDPTQSTAEPFRVIALVVAALTYGGWLLRLATIHEERDDYRLPVATAGFAWGNRGDRQGVNQQLVRQLERGGLISAIGDRWFDRRLAARPRGWRLLGMSVGLWPTTVRAAWAFVVFGLIFAAMAQGFAAIGGSDGDVVAGDKTSSGGYRSGMVQGVLVQPMLFVHFMPAMIAAQQLVGRRPQHATELLRPADRPSYIRQLFSVVFYEAAWTMLALLLVSGGLAAWFVPDALSIGRLAELAAFAVVCNVLSVAAQLVMATCRLGIVGTMLGILPVLPVATAGMVRWQRTQVISPEVAGVILLAAAVAGVALLAFARRRWMQMEFA